jgi:glucose-6-phosphate 1-dehydrogenase
MTADAVSEARDEARPGPTTLVLFGATGDLAWRKVLPAIYNLFRDGWLAEHFAVVGVGRSAMSDDAFRQHVRSGVDQFSRSGPADAATWDQFAAHLSYRHGDLADPNAYAALADRLASLEHTWGADANRIFYLALPPSMFGVVAHQLGQAGLTQPAKRVRVVIEKPFGHDLASAQALNAELTGIFAESQLYRIDHYLGKETVQNLLAFRFANAIFEPVWDRRYVDSVQITVAEQVGLEHRGDYYDHSGALRDMVQSHLMQVLCLIAMEPPVDFSADEVRNKKLDVLRAIRHIPADQVARFAVRGQYTAGAIDGAPVPGYRDEEGVGAHSTTETFAALRFFIDNWRWQDVPFYLRTGKRLAQRVSEVSVQFRPVPHQPFPPTAVRKWQPNRLAVHLQPKEGILLRFQAKQPGPTFNLSPVDMTFRYEDTFRTAPPEAYETLLLDVMRGDPTLFMRADQVEAAWSLLEPVLNDWAGSDSADLAAYPAGTWGPPAVDALLAQDGEHWLLPTAVEPSSP